VGDVPLKYRFPRAKRGSALPGISLKESAKPNAKHVPLNMFLCSGKSGLLPWVDVLAIPLGFSPRGV